MATDTATVEARRAALAALPISDHFQALRDEHAAEHGGVEPLATIDLHDGDGANNGLGRRLKRWSFEEFDEESIGDYATPGRNVLVLRFAGVRKIQTMRVISQRAEPRREAQPAPTPTPAPVVSTPPMGSTDIVGLMMTMMQAMNQQSQQAAQASQATNTLLLGKLLESNQRSPERSMLQELVELDDLLDRRASKRAGDGNELAGQIAPLLAAFTDGVQKAKAETPAATATPATPAAKQLPAAAGPTKDQQWEALILRIADLLAAGAKHPDADAEAYALVVLDYIEAMGFDAQADIFAKVPADGLAAALCAKFQQLPLPFVVSVERSMRSLVSADDEPADPAEGKDSTDEDETE